MNLEVCVTHLSKGVLQFFCKHIVNRTITPPYSSILSEAMELFSVVIQGMVGTIDKGYPRDQPVLY